MRLLHDAHKKSNIAPQTFLPFRDRAETFNRPVQTDHACLGIVPPLFASAAVGNEARVHRESA
ncbi:hypothetical protein METHPM2_210023 [Pseudomonas sp. PM2]